MLYDFVDFGCLLFAALCLVFYQPVACRFVCMMCLVYFVFLFD